MNQTFAPARFLNLLKRYIVENRKQLTFLYGVMWGVMILVILILTRSNNIHTLVTAESDSITIGLREIGERIAVYTFFLLGFGSIVSSYMFSNFTSKRGRISALMVPASMTEKYLVRFTVYIIGFLVMFVIGVILSEFAYICYTKHPDAFRLSFFCNSQHIFNDSVMLSILSYQAIFALGSAIWPRRSFFKTFTVIFVLMVFGMFNTSIVAIFFNGRISYWVNCTIIILACYVLAWIRFRKIQVIQRFM